MEIDKAVLDSLPLAQRQKLLKQLRQQQVKRYNQWIESFDEEQDSKTTYGKPNRKGKNVKFGVDDRLKDAISRYDDREGGSNLYFINSTCNIHWESH